MGLQSRPEEHRTGLARRLVANGDDHIRMQLRQLIPRFAAQPIGVHPFAAQGLQGAGMYDAGRKAAGAEALHAVGSQMIECGLSQNAATAVLSAEKQNFHEKYPVMKNS